MDQTRVSTVLKPNKIVAVKGKNEVLTLQWYLPAISASGNTVPSILLFPHKKFKSQFINGGLPDCLEEGNVDELVTDAKFFQIIHFVKHVIPSNMHRVLLVLDNHFSHLYVKELTLAQENNFVILSFPPHCSHSLHPSQDTWLRNNLEKTIAIYDIPKIIVNSLPLSISNKSSWMVLKRPASSHLMRTFLVMISFDRHL